MPHLANSPDLARSDHHLLRSLEHFIRDKNYQDYQSIQNDLDLFPKVVTQPFYRDGIRKLLEDLTLPYFFSNFFYQTKKYQTLF